MLRNMRGQKEAGEGDIIVAEAQGHFKGRGPMLKPNGDFRF